MAGLPSDALLDCKRHLRRYKNTGEGYHEPIILQVLGFYRQIIDGSFKSVTGLDAGRHTECYDVLVSDGNRKLKCILNPNCNSFLQKGQVTVGSVIQLSFDDLDLHYNETELSAPSLVIINNLSLHRAEPLQLTEGTIPHSSEAGEKEAGDVPIATRRTAYLSPWCAEDPEGPVWCKIAPEHDTRIDLGRTVTLQHLAANWRTIGRSGRPLLVRILHKSRLRHFGKAGQSQALPFQAYLEIADRTGVASAVLWSSMCTDFYCSLKEGDSLFITNYSVRGRYQIMSKPTMRNTDLDRFDLEVSLNKQGKVRGVKVVPPDDVQDAWELPTLRYLFITRKQLRSIPDEFNCDIAGIVNYVGRYERHRKPGTSSEFWLSRWIHLHDVTSEEPIRILVFATSQPESHRCLCPGSLCIITQLRVRHNLNQLVSSRQRRTVYLTTTNESQVYVHDGDVEGPYQTNAVVEQVVRWRNGPGYRETSSWRRLGGYYSYAPLPTTLDAYKASFTNPADFQVTPIEDLRRTAEDLKLYETHRMVIQGFILWVRFTPIGHEQRSDDAKNDEQKTYSLRSSSQESASTSSGKNQSVSQDKGNKASLRTTQYEAEVGEGVQPQLLDTAVRTGTAVPSASFLLRRYDPHRKVDVLSALNFPEIPSGQPRSQEALSEHTIVGTAGYFVITICGLNRNHLLHTLYLAPADLSRHDSFLNMLSHGEVNTSGQTVELPSKKVLNSILSSSKDCGDQRLVFVLDLYNPGGQEVEVVLNRAFPVGPVT